MKRLSLLVLAAASFVAVPVATTSTAQALPLCVQYVDPIHMGSYQVCPLGKSGAVQAAPKVPTSVCDAAELVGYRWVKDCEGPLL
jgi:hypothetical protein